MQCSGRLNNHGMAVKFTRTEWIVSTSTAIDALETTVASATATGHDELAAAGERLSHVVINVFQPVQNPETELSPADFVKLEQKIEGLQEEVRGLQATPELNKFREFQCNREFRACVASSASRSEQAACWMAFVACLGSSIAAALRRDTPPTP